MFGWLHNHCGAGRGSGVNWKLGVPVPLPRRYQVPNVYCKTFCTINTIILSPASDSVSLDILTFRHLDRRTSLEKSSPFILRRVAAASRAGLFSCYH